MRCFSLIGLPGPNNERLHYVPPTDDPLILPNFLSEEQRSAIITFFQQVITDQPLPRVEVEWKNDLLSTDQRYLDYLRRRYGSNGNVVVIHLISPNLDLREIRLDKTLRQFRYLVFNCRESAQWESLGTLSSLTLLVKQHAQDLYLDLVEPLGLRAGAWQEVQPLINGFLSPVDVLETVNDLIDGQLNSSDRERIRDAVHARRLAAELSQWDAEPLIALLGLATNKTDDVEKLLGSAEIVEAQWQRLKRRNLLLDGELQRWARYIRLRSVAESLSARLPTRAQATEDWAPKVRKALSWLGSLVRPVSRDELEEELYSVFPLINEGKLVEATHLLEKLEPTVEAPDTELIFRGDYWDAVGRLRASGKEIEESIQAFKTSLELLEQSHASPMRRGMTMDSLARSLRNVGRWDEAEPLFRESLRLGEEGGDTPTSLALTMRELATCLRQRGQSAEAKTFDRKAERLEQ